MCVHIFFHTEFYEERERQGERAAFHNDLTWHKASAIKSVNSSLTVLNVKKGRKKDLKSKQPYTTVPDWLLFFFFSVCVDKSNGH